MTKEPISLLGGKSVYCINEGQLADAMKMADEQSESGEKVRTKIEEIEADMTRNERCAMAFVLLDRLLKSTD